MAAKLASASTDSGTASQPGQRVAQGNAAAERCSNKAAAASRGSGRGSISTGNNVIEERRGRQVCRAMTVQKPVGQLRIRLFEQALECGTPVRIGHCPATIKPAAKQQVELPHATTASPAEDSRRNVRHAGINRHD